MPSVRQEAKDLVSIIQEQTYSMGQSTVCNHGATQGHQEHHRSREQERHRPREMERERDSVCGNKQTIKQQIKWDNDSDKDREMSGIVHVTQGGWKRKNIEEPLCRNGGIDCFLWFETPFV